MRRVTASVPLALAAVSLAVPALAQTKAGPEFRVNATTALYQYVPKVAAAAGGDFVVVWTSYDGIVANAVRAQRFDARGNALGAEFQVNAGTTATGSRYDVNLGMDRKGNFVVVWGANYPGGYGLDVVGQRFDRRARRVGAEFLVNVSTSSSEAAQDVSMTPDGAFVVVWSSFQDDLDALARIFDRHGVASSGEFLISGATTGIPGNPAVGLADDGTLLAAFDGRNAQGETGLFGQRHDRTGKLLGSEFRVTATTTEPAGTAEVDVAPDQSFIVSWTRGGAALSVFARRFAANGAPLGAQFQIDGGGESAAQSLDHDASGRFVVAWTSDVESPGSGYGVRARRFDAQGAPLGPEFQVNAYTTGPQYLPQVTSDAVGNFVVAWTSFGQGDYADVFAQRFGGLLPSALAVEDGANGVLEVPEDFVLRTSWRNVNGAAQTFQGGASNVQAPAGLLLTLSPQASYGTVADGAVGACTAPCFAGGLAGSRPPGHQDARFSETIAPAAQGQLQQWRLHVGGSFIDVPRTSIYYRFVETLLHQGVSAGCGGNAYCPGLATTREEMAVFLLAAAEGEGFSPPACTTPVFGDVPAGSPFCPFIEELARRGVTGGCGGGNFCPEEPVTREQMAVFLLRTLDPTLDPPACTTPVFDDVPAASPFCRWIEELARRGLTSGCGGGSFCPAAPVEREQMAVFLTTTFGLTLYGP
jgi:hypothetical protein